MKSIPLSRVQAVAVSPGSDQLIVVRIPGNDLVICLHNEKQENRVAELVGLLSHITKKLYSKELTVEVNENFSCELGNKPKRLSINSAHGTSTPNFQFQGKDNIMLNSPA